MKVCGGFITSLIRPAMQGIIAHFSQFFNQLVFCIMGADSI
jgi:hypothetical protein